MIIARGSSTSFLLDADNAPSIAVDVLHILSLILSVTEFLPPPTVSEIEWTKDRQCPDQGGWGPDAGHMCCMCFQLLSCA